MNIELKQAAQRALLALRNSQPHPSNPFIGLTDKDFIDHEETIRQLRNALQQAAHTTQTEVTDEKPVPDLMTALCHEAIGWNAHRAAMLAAKEETP